VKAPIRALLQLLSGRQPDPPLTEAEWSALRELADRTHCTLYCGLGGSALQDNAARRRRLWRAYDEAAALLSGRGIDFVLLKGFTHETDFGIDPTLRYQSDLDFLCRPDDLAGARAALEEAGYRPHGSADLSANHSRPLVKPSAWQWTGNYFDPDLPVSIELHHTLWSGERDRIPAPGTADFWNRRTSLSIEGRDIPALAEPDRIAFASLHVLRHILRNNVSPAHVFELSKALTRRAHNEAFWETWTSLHPPGLRALQAVAFQFAHRWFGCELSPTANREWRALPDPVHAWLRDCAFSPLANLLEPNKDALWLHLALVPRRMDRFALGFRGLIPMRVPHSEEQRSVVDRGRYHAVALARTLLKGSWRRRQATSTASQTSD
jgi:putative nucleotidyltransferase-like protein